jgi:hypothetical protein
MLYEKGQSRNITDLDLNPNLDKINRDENAPDKQSKEETVNELLARLTKSSGGASKRYNVVLPQEMFDELQNIADERGVSVVEMLRKFIKLGILASWLEELPDAALIIREGDNDRELLLI